MVWVLRCQAISGFHHDIHSPTELLRIKRSDGWFPSWHNANGHSVHDTRLGWRFSLCEYCLRAPPSYMLNDSQGFDNGWWGTILGSQTFLSEYGSCSNVDGTRTCNLSTAQLSAGSSVQSGGISEVDAPLIVMR